MPIPPEKEGSKQVIIGFKSQVKSKTSSETWKQGELVEVLEGESTVGNVGASSPGPLCCTAAGSAIL